MPTTFTTACLLLLPLSAAPACAGPAPGGAAAPGAATAARAPQPAARAATRSGAQDAEPLARAPDDVFTPHLVESLKAVGSTAVSPGGAHVAFTRSVPRTAGKDEDGAPWSELWVLDTATGLERAFVTGKGNVGSLGWTSDGSAITFLAKRGEDKFTALYVLPIGGGEARRAAELKSSISAYSLAPDGSRVALLAAEPESEARKKAVEKGFKQQVYEEDLVFTRLWLGELFGSEFRAVDFPEHVHALDWSPAGDRIAVRSTPTPLVDDEYVRQRVRLLDDSGALLHEIDNPGKLGDLAWSPDGAWLAFLSAADRHDPSDGRLALVGKDGGALRWVLAPDWPGDVAAFGWLDARHLLAVTTRGARQAFERIDVSRGTASERLELIRPGVAIYNSFSVDGAGAGTVAFAAHTAQHPPELMTFSPGDVAPLRRTRSNPVLEGLRFARQELVRHRARDGVELEGVLIRPLDEQEGQRHPLILYVHGGPEAHESDGWLTNYSRPGQIAAARGFAVFHPNYRGSTGQGVAFSKLSQADAAGKEFDDLVDAAQHLIEAGLADPARIGVTGGSYGGYATAWCATKLSEHFAAGVMFVGISDKLSKVGTTDIPDEEFLVHALKRPWDDWLFFLERSPIYHAGKARTPLLILHGKDDPRVDPGQSREMYRHLKLRGQAPVRLVLYPGEGHGNRKAGARLDYCLRMLQWFEHYLLGPGGAPPDKDLDYADPREAAPAKG